MSAGVRSVTGEESITARFAAHRDKQPAPRRQEALRLSILPGELLHLALKTRPIKAHLAPVRDDLILGLVNGNGPTARTAGRADYVLSSNCAKIRPVKTTSRGLPASGSLASAPLPETTVKTKVWLERDGAFVIGDGGLRLLLGIIEHGSLLRAAREIRWSYRHAWGYLRRAEAALGAPLTVPRPGKGASRGTALTEVGRLVIEQLAKVRNRIDDAVGPTGPTAADVASRGASVPRGGRAPSTRAPYTTVSRYRDGDWRRRR